MFRIPRDNPWPPQIDLSTVRETLSYMRDDMKRVPQFEQIAAALENAISELDKAEAKSPRVLGPGVVTHSRFVPYRK